MSAANLQKVLTKAPRPWYRPSLTTQILFGLVVGSLMESLMQVMFKFTNYVMMFAPIGVGAAMAHTVGTQGLGVLLNLGNLILSLYLALLIFIVLVFGAVILLFKVPLKQFIRAVREPA